MPLETVQARVDDLHLDRLNPRLPERMRGASEDVLLPFITEEYNAIAIARSIARHGYFLSEPLIAVEEDGVLVVVEGNRRLSALKLLASETLRRHPDIEDTEEWEELARSPLIPSELPVLVAESRAAVAPIIGFRHISGIEPWESWAKARFIAGLVDNEGKTFEQVAEMIGENVSDVRSHYRNQAIIQQARTEFDIQTERAENLFGVFTAAMNIGNLRQYISAPKSGEVRRGGKPVPAERRAESNELFSWLYGIGEETPVIRESRDLRRLGEVVASEDGLRVLRETRNLAEAEIAAGGLLNRLLRRLGNARSSMRAAQTDITTYGQEQEVQELLQSCADELDRLRELAQASP
jgi:hypothetical protein